MPAPSDLWIKVPGPFFGVDSVGFSVRCPDAAAPGPLPDVPFFVEGDPDRITPLADRLRRFPERERYVDCAALGEAYSWTDPISLSDQVIVLALRDRSLLPGPPGPVTAVRNRLANQLVPLAFPFLRDCVRVAGLRLSSPLSVRISARDLEEVELRVELAAILPGNGAQSLAEL